MYAEIEVHRTMICDRVRTDAFRRAIEAVVRPGDVVLDLGAGSGILSAFAARAGAARVYAVERTAVAALAEELAVENGIGEIIEVIHGDVADIALPERVDVIVSEWLGGFGIDEGMLVPVIAARDRWLKPGGVMIPRSVTAWAALVHDRHLDETVEFLRGPPYGLRFDGLVDKTVNEVSYSGSFRHLAASDKRSDASRLWTTDAGRSARAGARAARSGNTARGSHARNGERARTLVQHRARSRHLALDRAGGSADALGDDDGTAACARRAHARNVGPRTRAHRPRSSDRHLDELGDRAPGRRLGSARRADRVGGARRLTTESRVGALPRRSKPRRTATWQSILVVYAPQRPLLDGRWPAVPAPTTTTSTCCTRLPPSQR